MSRKEEKKNKLNPASERKEEQYSLNDDRRVKVLSPGALVAKRFFRNRMAMVGLIILIAMFAFSFIGGLVSPYKENQPFYRTDIPLSRSGEDDPRGQSEPDDLRI